MHHVKAMHVLQPIRNINQLKQPIMFVSAGCDVITYKLDLINPVVPLHVLVDVTIIHPFRYHGELVPFYIHTQQR